MRAGTEGEGNASSDTDDTTEGIQVLLKDDGDILTRSGGERRYVKYHTGK